MQTKVSSEFMYQIFSLILALIVVHTIYLTLIRPNANNLLENQLAKEEAGEPYVAVRSFILS